MAELKVEVSDAYWPVVLATKPIVDTIIEEEQSFDQYIEILIWRGIKGVIADIVGQDADTLFGSIIDLHAANPEFVSSYIQARLQSGAAANAKGRLGFVKR